MPGRTELLLVLVVSLAGCGACPATVELFDEHDYSFAGTLAIERIPLAAGSDPTIDWSGLGTDLLGHEVDAAGDILTVAVAIFEDLSPEEVEQGLAEDSLVQSDLTLYVSASSGGATSLPLSALTMLGTDVDVEQYFVEGAGSWLVLVSDSEEVGLGARMLGMLLPDAASDQTVASLDDGSAVLTMDVDLSALEPLTVPTAEPALALDWTTLEHNGRGSVWVDGRVDRAMVAHFDTLDATGIEAAFADVELLADELWSLDFGGGATVDLAPLAEQDPPFTGIDDQGTWALALFCTSCANPAPPFFTLLEPCP